ncbi:hypothetical protein ACFYZ9_20330 [Streptomyces sp. NPDC001691]|uniref:hypothetical protein n=1 Tax=unclassified Streptomyces TaxID=2593676 RepID=UPI000DE8745B|nr:hypothetical protein [Streptomyces sp. SDr-06]RCH69255.1 hypothetical protein DT019_04845 [Streptomyces sp. SDr-06]
MHKTGTLALTLLAVAALLTGCGSEKKDDGGAARASAPAGSGAKGLAPDRKGVAHQVVFEVGGTGAAQVMWIGNTNHFEQVTLPWTKTESVTLEGAELKVGHTVSVVPGSIKRADGSGMLQAAPCTIKVDGKQVADNQNGKSDKLCEYQLKD